MAWKEAQQFYHPRCASVNEPYPGQPAGYGFTVMVPDMLLPCTVQK